MKRISMVFAALVAATLAASADEAATPVSAPQAAPSEGNPLWAISSDRLAVTRDRPLFSPSRRPPAPIVEAPSAPPAAVAEAKQAAPERPPFKLLGTIVGLEAQLALLRDRSNTVLRLHEGEVQSGWRALKVAERSIMLGRGAEIVTLELPKPSDAANDPSEQSAEADPDAAVPVADADAAAPEPAAATAAAMSADPPATSDGDQPAGPGVMPHFRH